MRAKILITEGMRFGRLIVIRKEPKDKRYKDNHTRYLCKCDCGNETIVRSDVLRKGRTKSCGCLLSECKDIKGVRFGRLLALEHIGMSSDRTALWKCKCDCGNIIIARECNLHNGNTKSCGCYAIDRIREANTKHGLYGTRLYRIWHGMKYRCYNSNADEYPNYGGKGVVVCDDWKDDFSKFNEWALSHGYQDNLTIDRIDANGNYEPSNCQWVTLEENVRNVNKKNFVRIFGENYSINQLSQLLNVTSPTLCSRRRTWGEAKFIMTIENIINSHDNSPLYIRKEYSNLQTKTSKQ